MKEELHKQVFEILHAHPSKAITEDEVEEALAGTGLMVRNVVEKVIDNEEESE